MSDYQMFEVQVSQVEPLTEQVKRFTLVATDGKPLPAFTGGSHVIVQMSDGDNQYSNAYSLLSSPHDTSCYQIAVRLEENSRGGSRFLHQQVKVGNRLTISTPNNLFALIPSARKHLFIAGGIGITPDAKHDARDVFQSVVCVVKHRGELIVFIYRFVLRRAVGVITRHAIGEELLRTHYHAAVSCKIPKRPNTAEV